MMTGTRSRIALTASMLAMIVAAGPVLAGNHHTSGVGGGPVGHHAEGEKIGSEGDVSALARSYVNWADNRSSVTLEDGFGDVRYCAPGDCISDGRSTVPADRLVIESRFVVWGKDVTVTDSGAATAGKDPGITIGRSKTTGEKIVTVSWLSDAAARGETSQSVSGIRIDGRGLSRADHVVLATAQRNGQSGHAEARTTTYLR